MVLDWIKYPNGNWCDLLGLNLDDAHFNNMDGVYIIWSNKGYTVRIGQGIVKDRFTDHRGNRLILNHPVLFATWAKVPAHLKDGVERYLANVLKPVVGDAFPQVAPIQVNLPW